QQVGDFVQAGEAYLQAGQLEMADKCMHQAGETKRASEIGGRYYEAKGQWKEAGMAYEGGGNFKKAGDCFSKANDPAKAGTNYERAREYYGAGLAMVHAQQWKDAVRLFQQVGEDHPQFSVSRGLLGRAFYELKDYAHSAATLENHLLGERVRKDNIDYFWMLALAFEQLGKLKESEDTLLKIRTVDVQFRDVAQRLSNVQTRISLVATEGSATSNMPTMATPAQQGGKSPVMSMVEKSLENRYELEKELGRGGMGVVYLARDTQLDRPVALKFLGTLVDGSEEFRLRFKREAQAAAQVSHPNILSIYDIGVEQGSSYIAMEYIEGPNFNQYLKKKGKLSAREAVNLVGQACAALEAIHQAGITHRDIKPDNILIAKGDLVKLMDFGLAKGHGANLTGSHVIMGTPCYMAPEQARGEVAGPRSDIYAMGLVLYELLSGKTVFEDGNVMERQITEVPPLPSSCVEGVPPELDALIMKCIAKKPEERFQTAQEMIDALRQVGT
ncbi:MAG: serine/threonine protein kinase, partial [Candidatus Hydrogenedentes bacterium]|nr:serine/threonine protein kinase [Candidatus Hydrogenedentota bacterium]